MITINESFECIHCKKIIPKALSTCRNHCPYCFISRHVDGDIPWDRSSICQGIMIPTGYQFVHQHLKIEFECIICGKRHHNKTASDDNILALDEYISYYYSLTPHELDAIRTTKE